MAAFRKAYPELDAVYCVEADDKFRPSSNNYAIARANAGKAPVYNYVFAFESRIFSGMLAGHTCDVPFALANTAYDESLTDPVFTPVLEREMSSAWVSFAGYGDPNNPLIPEWKRYDSDNRYTMVFSCRIRCSKGSELEYLVSNC